MFRSEDLFSHELNILQQQGSLRQTLSVDERLNQDGKKLINLASNDYLSLATLPFDHEDFNHFYCSFNLNPWQFASTGSPLLTGYSSFTKVFEEEISRLSGKAALAFNSGFEANCGVLEVVGASCLILADKLSHASILDGITKASKAKVMRFSHNNLEHLELLLNKYEKSFEQVLIISESIFSMDGDFAPLEKLVALKQKHPKVMLYIDEAHAFGVFGENGLGIAESLGIIDDIDLIVGTFGKAVGSMGAFVVGSKVFIDFLINKSRPFIFSTALPPICIAFSKWIIENKFPQTKIKRQRMLKIARQMGSSSQIIPVIVGENKDTVDLCNILFHNGYFTLPIRPPTVPVGTSRIRLSLTSEIEEDELIVLKEKINASSLVK